MTPWPEGRTAGSCLPCSPPCQAGLSITVRALTQGHRQQVRLLLGAVATGSPQAAEATVPPASLLQLSIMLPEPGKAGRGMLAPQGEEEELPHTEELPAVHSSALPVRCPLPPSSPHPAFLRSDEPKGPPWPPLGPLPPGTTVKPPRGLGLCSAVYFPGAGGAEVTPQGLGAGGLGFESPLGSIMAGDGRSATAPFQASFPHPPNEDGSSR